MANLAVEAKAQDINFITKFEASMAPLLAILGKTDVETVAPGAAYKIYKTSGTIGTGEVAEKALIPDAGIELGNPQTLEITYKKFRNMTGIEKIGKHGYTLAVGKTNNDLLRQVQNKVRTSIYAGISEGTGTGTGATFQVAVANAAAEVAVKFEGEAATPVFFVNPRDLFGYLGTANITLQTAFGLSYLQNFMGIGNVVADSNVTQGTVIGTAVENLTVLAPTITDIPGMELTTDESGIIAVHNGAVYENAAVQTVVYCGLGVYPVFLDRIFKVTIGA